MDHLKGISGDRNLQMAQIKTENAYQVSYYVVVCPIIAGLHSNEVLTILQVGEGQSMLSSLCRGPEGPQVLGPEGLGSSPSFITF